MRRGIRNQPEHLIILIKYVAVHPTPFSEKYSLLGMLTILIKVQTVSAVRLFLWRLTPQVHGNVPRLANVVMFKNLYSTRVLEMLPGHKKERRQPNIGKTNNDARIITLKPSAGTVLLAPHGKGNKCDFTRTRQIIRYRATATLRRLQIKQYAASNEARRGGVTKPSGTSDNYDKVRSGSLDGRFGKMG